MKKILLSLGTIATVIAPIAATVACTQPVRNDTYVEPPASTSNIDPAPKGQEPVVPEQDSPIDLERVKESLESIIHLSIKDIYFENTIVVSKNTTGTFKLEFMANEPGSIYNVKIGKDSEVTAIINSADEWSLVINNSDPMKFKNEPESKQGTFYDFMMYFESKTIKATDEAKEKLMDKLRASNNFSGDMLIKLASKIKHIQYNFELQNMLKIYLRSKEQLQISSSSSIPKDVQAKTITYFDFK